MVFVIVMRAFVGREIIPGIDFIDSVIRDLNICGMFLISGKSAIFGEEDGAKIIVFCGM